MIKAVIFDMDGLMIDSERVTFECYQEILKPMNLTMDETFYKTLLGKPIKGIYERFYSTYGQDFPIESVIKDVHALMAKRFETEGVPVKKGLLVLLNYLKENGELWIVIRKDQGAKSLIKDMSDIYNFEIVKTIVIYSNG